MVNTSAPPAKLSKTTRAAPAGPPSKPRRRGGRASKDKGSAYERELAAYLTTHLGLPSCMRMPLSGGGTFGTHLGGADLTGTPHLHIEAKRTERLNVRDALRQAERSILASSTSDLATVITRCNREPLPSSLVVMRLSDWTRLYAAYLAQEGFVFAATPTQQQAETFAAALDHPLQDPRLPEPHTPQP